MSIIKVNIAQAPSHNIVVAKGATSLDQLNDVSIINPVDGQALIRDNGVWRNVGFAATDANFLHNQSSASAVWTVIHNLNKYPSVTVVDSANDEVEGNVNHISVNQLQISFSAAFSGKAFLN